MKTMEEQIWDYIDGLTTGEERRLLEEKIATDARYAAQYKALLAVNQLLQQTELEEPSMSFTRNLMAQVALEPQPIALHTKVDQRIIYGIAAMFLFIIVGLLFYALSNSNISMSMEEITVPNLQVNIDMNFSNLMNPIALKVFFCVDILLALIYFDRLLRSRTSNP
ncbi:anti-sigma factor family protein [Pedobacter sp.]|uniref:anti-sigma factor family protein n=1 Tax=Pedobacter sp. TaxID=1411316 RepID=UPI003D7F2FE2